MTPLNIPGIDNGYIVDDAIWRGAQPSDLAWQALRNAGCRLVVDLNSGPIGSVRQGNLVRSTGMMYLGLGWDGILPPPQPKVDVALSILDTAVKNGHVPIFVHCQYGSDRTGTLCAIWRMHHDGWTFRDAMDEAFCKLGLQGEHEFWMAAAVAEYAERTKK